MSSRPCRSPTGNRGACSCYDDDEAADDEDEDHEEGGDASSGSLDLVRWELCDPAPGRVTTRAMRMDGLEPTYLPPVDAIMFVRVDPRAKVRQVWEVPWAAALAEPGLLARTREPLARWRAGAFPSDAWLDAHGTRQGS